jgi:hypothetical protein
VDRARTTVGTSYDDGVFILGFQGEDGAPLLVVSRSDTSDEQDAFLGIDTYCISTQDGATFYGGVESVKLDGTSLELRFVAEAAAALGIARDLLLILADRADADAARAGLRRLGVAITGT